MIILIRKMHEVSEAIGRLKILDDECLCINELHERRRWWTIFSNCDTCKSSPWWDTELKRKYNNTMDKNTAGCNTQ